MDSYYSHLMKSSDLHARKVSARLATPQLVRVGEGLPHDEHLGVGEAPLLVERPDDGLGLCVGQTTLARPAPADAFVAVVLVERPDSPNLVPAHNLGHLSPHEPKPIPDVVQAVQRPGHVLGHLDLGPLPSITRELRLVLETLRTGFSSFSGCQSKLFPSRTQNCDIQTVSQSLVKPSITGTQRKRSSTGSLTPRRKRSRTRRISDF